MTVIVRRSPSRALTLVEPFYLQRDILEEAEQLLERAFSRPFFPEDSFIPKVDIFEEKNELVIKGELPGVKEEDLDIGLKDGILTIKAEKKQEEVTEEATYYRREQSYGQYYRSIQLPSPVKEKKISAKFENGLLEIRLPRAEEAKPKRIEVKTSAPKLKKPRTTKSKSK